MKKRSYSLYKKEKERYSILTSNLEKCILCPKKRTNLHEIFEGRNRQSSIKYGLVIPLCYQCHLKIHRERTLSLIWKIKGQTAFEEKYPDLDFIKIFEKNYK